MASAPASERLRQASDRIWQGLHAHPFITELAGGTLPIDKFRFFLEQDNLYLQDYARCLAMGAAKSRNEVELRYFVTDLNQVIEKELPSNRDLLARVTQMGALDRGGAAGMAPANVAYTSYMRSLALHGGPLEIMASLLPCAWSYIEIATALADRVDRDHPVYADWVGYFSLPQNVEMVGEMRRDFDRLVADEASGQARWEEIERIFATSSRLEHQFWEMAYTLERWPDLREDYATP